MLELLDCSVDSTGLCQTHIHITVLNLAQKKTRVRLWLYEDARMQIEGQIIGFDEYMK